MVIFRRFFNSQTMESPDIDHFDPKTDDVLPAKLLKKALTERHCTINEGGSSPLVVTSYTPPFLPSRVRDYLTTNGVIGQSTPLKVKIPAIHDEDTGATYFYNPNSGDRIIDRSGMY